MMSAARARRRSPAFTLGRSLRDLGRFPRHRSLGTVARALGVLAGLVGRGVVGLLWWLWDGCARSLARASRFTIADLMWLAFIVAILLAMHADKSDELFLPILGLLLVGQLVRRSRRFDPSLRKS